MTLYFAICDDNIADRKQTERLLEREKDKRLAETGDVIYIESFGSSDALMKTPIRYDMFIIDITQSEQNGMDVAKSLRSVGIIAPICLLSSKYDYSSYASDPGDIIHISKPISRGHISHLCDIARNWAEKKPPLLEIRGKKDTCFVPHEDLIRAVEKKNYVEVLLSDNTYIEVPGQLRDFTNVTSAYKCFVLCKDALLNIHHISSYSDHYFTLTNGEKYKLSHRSAEDILSQFVNFTSTHNFGKNQC